MADAEKIASDFSAKQVIESNSEMQIEHCSSLMKSFGVQTFRFFQSQYDGISSQTLPEIFEAKEQAMFHSCGWNFC